MPNKDNIRKWVDALRSGQYHQGNGRLKYKDNDNVVKHCCLGVACEVAIANGVEMDVDVYNYSSHDFKSRFIFDSNGGDLPEKVQKWLGILTPDPVLSNFGTATRLNDHMGYDFNDIANSIQSRFLND